MLLVPAGYPLEIHNVTTADGVVLQMERIPRPGCSRVAFFLHGILDTSLTWVSSGVTGSQVRHSSAWSLVEQMGFCCWWGIGRPLLKGTLPMSTDDCHVQLKRQSGCGLCLLFMLVVWSLLLGATHRHGVQVTRLGRHSTIHSLLMSAPWPPACAVFTGICCLGPRF